jgi:ABC-2 type transport system permease protein
VSAPRADGRRTADAPGRNAFVYRPTASPQAAASWTPRQVAMTNLRATWGRAYPRVTGMMREKSWVFFEILLPFLATSAFVFVYRALEAPPQYVGFVVLGGAMTAFWLNVIWMMAQQLWWEKSQGNLELYFAAPMHIMAVLFGMAVGGFVMSSTRAAAVLIISTTLFGVTFAIDQWALLIAVFFLTLAALYGLGMMLAGLFLMWGREAWHLTQLLIEPVYFVSGLNFPVGRLGVLGSVAISVLPLAVGLDAMRQLAFADAAYPIGTPGPAVEALILVGMVIAFIGLSRWTLAVLERRARGEGRLSVRWQ